MNKTYSMSIRVSEEELNRLKQAAKLESYSSYSEFVRRIALKEADKVIKKTEKIKRTLVRLREMSYNYM
ncbi:MAG: plasmid mobilization protein [Agathobacter rectalis]